MIQKNLNKGKHKVKLTKNPPTARSRGNGRRLAILWGVATFKVGPQVRF